MIHVQPTQLSRIFYRNNQLIVIGTDLKISTVKIPKIHNLYVSKSSAQAIAVLEDYSTIAYLTNNYQLKLWYYKENITVTKFHSEYLSPCIAINQNKLFVSDSKNVYVLGCYDNTSVKKRKKQEFTFSFMIVCENYLCCAGNSLIIYL